MLSGLVLLPGKKRPEKLVAVPTSPAEIRALFYFQEPGHLRTPATPRNPPKKNLRSGTIRFLGAFFRPDHGKQGHYYHPCGHADHQPAIKSQERHLHPSKGRFCWLQYTVGYLFIFPWPSLASGALFGDYIMLQGAPEKQ